ncbi:F420-nonreducing hydrogenase, partial [candidate division MSBL1 archaeon SCGC-AAA259O05]
MPDKVTIEPVTRIEGHAKVTIDLDEEGKVSDTKLQILQVRGFEKFMEGRQIEHAPVISPQICGICNEAHHVCSAKAVDDFFDVNPPEPAEKLRRLLHYAGIIQSHILHFYFLASPDFLFPSVKEKRNIIGIVDEKPELAKKVIDARKKAKELTKSIGGREIHPRTATAGGMTKPITEEERQKHMENMESLLEFGEESVELGKNLIEERKELLDSLGGIDSYQMALVNDGYHEVYDGQLRILDS